MIGGTGNGAERARKFESGQRCLPVHYASGVAKVEATNHLEEVRLRRKQRVSWMMLCKKSSRNMERGGAGRSVAVGVPKGLKEGQRAHLYEHGVKHGGDRVHVLLEVPVKEFKHQVQLAFTLHAVLESGGNRLE
jgi:hypothetical protein